MNISHSKNNFALLKLILVNLLCFLGNQFFAEISFGVLELPLFFDTVWTVAVMFYAGLPSGILQAVLFNLARPFFVHGFPIPLNECVYALCGVAIVIVTYFVVKPVMPSAADKRTGRRASESISADKRARHNGSNFNIVTISRLALAAVLASFASAIIGGIIHSVSLVYFSETRLVSVVEGVVQSFLNYDYGIFFSTVVARIPTTLVDRLITTFCGYGIFCFFKYIDEKFTSQKANILLYAVQCFFCALLLMIAFLFADSFAMTGDAFTLETARSEKIIRTYLIFFMMLSLVVVISTVTAIAVAIRLRLERQKFAASSEYARHIISAQEDERTRIARELHDTVLQDMKYIALSAEKISDTSLSRQIVQLQTKCIEEIRSVCQDLSLQNIDVTTFPEAIQNLASNVMQKNNLEIRITFLENAPLTNFSEYEFLNLYRIVQEALNNVAKHADASEATVLFKSGNIDNENHLLIIITDDGSGMDEHLLEKLNGDKSNHVFSFDNTIDKIGEKKFGTANMKARAKMLGGTLVFDSIKGDGVQITVAIPTIKDSGALDTTR